MDNEIVSNKILDKIAKLMRLSNNTSNVNEAATAYAQAQALLTKHRLTMAEVEAAANTLEAGEQIIESASPLYQGERVIHWKSNLACGIASFNGCKVFFRTFRYPEKKVVYVVVGRPSDITVVRYFFQSICVQIDLLCKNAMSCGLGNGKTFSNSFRLGAVETVLERLEAAHQQVRTEYSGSAALVLVNKKDAEVAVWMDRTIGKLKGLAGSPSRRDLSAIRLGRQAGRSVSLNRAIDPGGIKR